MEISLNGKKLLLSSPLSLRALQEQYCPDADVFIYNGFQTDEDLPLQDGDTVVLIRRGELPSEEQLESMMAARHTPFVHERVKKAKVGIAGLGGLGSNIAVMLARTGIGELVLADFDLVEPSNLNRQHYFISHLGQYKTQALQEQIRQINPFIQVKTHTVRPVSYTHLQRRKRWIRYIYTGSRWRQKGCSRKKYSRRRRYIDGGIR